MRGISFLSNNEYSNYLWKILKCVDILKYTWYIDQDEILIFNEIEGKVCNDFFKKTILTGEEFKEYIIRKSYYIISANIQAYPLNASQHKINSYIDFLDSKCEIILLCCDSRFFDFYCKHNEIIENVFKICMQNKFSNIKFITDENDGRTRLSI